MAIVEIHKAVVGLIVLMVASALPFLSRAFALLRHVASESNRPMDDEMNEVFTSQILERSESNDASDESVVMGSTRLEHDDKTLFQNGDSR